MCWIDSNCLISLFYLCTKNSRHSNGCNDDGEDQPDDGQSLSRSASENSVAQHERNNNNSTNNESINGYDHQSMFAHTDILNIYHFKIIIFFFSFSNKKTTDHRQVLKVVLERRIHHCTDLVKKAQTNK